MYTLGLRQQVFYSINHGKPAVWDNVGVVLYNIFGSLVWRMLEFSSSYLPFNMPDS